MSTPTVIHGDCMDVLKSMSDSYVDSIVTDPPYELGFMGKKWDGSGIAYSVELWRECLRVLKPGGHLASFGGTRTYHRMACAIEDAGFEIRDSLTWLYGSGFPKSLDVSKAIDKAAGAEREVIGASTTVKPTRNPASAGRFETGGYRWGDRSGLTWDDLPPQGREYYGAKSATRGQITAPATDVARQWQGWGTALKPAVEPIVLARKPLVGTVAANVLAHGTGALNIDGTRVGWDAASLAKDTARRAQPRTDITGGRLMTGEAGAFEGAADSPPGRWPANVLLTHGPDCADVCTPGCPAAELDAQSGTTTSKSGGTTTHALGVMNDDAWVARELPRTGHDDKGGASRFFPVFRYQAKAPAKERPKVDGVAHPTVKPLDLMRWLVRLVTPPGGTVLDPFAGSGTTVEAALLEGFQVIGVEREADYLPLIEQRRERVSLLGVKLGLAGGQPLVSDLDYVTEGDAAVDGGEKFGVGVHEYSIACAHHATQGVIA